MLDYDSKCIHALMHCGIHFEGARQAARLIHMVH